MLSMNVNQVLANIAKSPAQAAQAALAAIATLGLVLGLTMPLLTTGTFTERSYGDIPVTVKTSDYYTPTDLTPGFQGDTPVLIHKAQAVGDDAIAVWYEGGAAECVGYSANVVETADSITVEILSGIIPGSVSDDEPCDLAGQYRVSVLHTSAPIAGRTLKF